MSGPSQAYVLTSLLAAVLLTQPVSLRGYQHNPKSIKRDEMTKLSPNVQHVFSKTRTICFGRFTMQVPASGIVTYGPAEVETPVDYLVGERDKMEAHISARLQEIEKERKSLMEYDIPRLPLFGQILNGVLPGQKIVYGSKDQVGYSIHSFVPIGNDLFIQYVDSALPNHDIPSIMNSVAKRIRPRREDDIPTEPGTCIDGAFVSSETKYERVTMGITLKEFPDIRFSVEVHRNPERLQTSGALELMRKQAAKAARESGQGAIFDRIKVLRRQTRQLGEWSGTEIATRTPAYKDEKEAHEFRYQSLGAVDDSLHPLLDIRMYSGVQGNHRASVKPSLSDEDALALWDQLIESIEIRKTTKAPLATPAKPPLPLSSKVCTGDACPQTGWWQCTESTNVEGGRRRHFKENEPFPCITLLGKPTLWQHITGDRTRHLVSTVWTLMEYDDAAHSASSAANDQPGAV